MKTLKYFFLLPIVLGLMSCNQNKPASSNVEALGEDLQRVMIEPLHYVCYQAPDSIVVDGKLDDAAWATTAWSTDFVDIEGEYKPKPTYQTRVKMLYDAHYLYVAAELQEPHIWAYLSNHDDIVFRDNDFEIFVDPDNDTWNYFEYEINAQQTVFDLLLPQPYRSISAAVHTWDFKGVKKGVHLQGTLNNGTDTDQKWTIEIAIPFSALAFGLETGQPDTAKAWRINFSRVEWDTQWKDGKYEKLTDEKGKPLPEHNWVWSPVGVISMHMPERWGYLKFSSTKAGEGSQEFVLNESEKHKQVLWAVFYRQEAFKAANKKFTVALPDLGNDLTSLIPEGYQLKLQGSELFYTCELLGSDGATRMWINSNGKIQEIQP
jgi:hypothetical protein